MRRSFNYSRPALLAIGLLASAILHSLAATVLAQNAPSTPRVFVTESGQDYMRLTVPIPYFNGDSGDEALKRELSTDAGFGTRIIYVAVPDCDGVGVECGLNQSRRAGGNAMRRSGERLARVIAVSRIRDQTVAVLSMDTEAIQRLDPHDDESLQLDLRFHNPRGPANSDLGVMKRSVDRLLIRDRSAVLRHRGGRRPIATTSIGQVTWATGSTWQQAMQSAVDANTDYLMIMADELSEDLVASLATKRATVNDLNVTIVRMSQIDADPDTLTTATTIRDLIKGVYDSRSAAHSSDSLLSYVLLIGDAVRPDTTTLIPSYNDFSGSYVYASDSYYSFLSEEDAEDDVFPDVFLGRLPVDATSSASPPDPDWELRNVVNKIWGYEPASLPDRKVLLVSGGNQLNLPKFQPYFAYLMDRLPSSVVADSLHRRSAEDDDGDDIDGSDDQAFSARVADSLNTDTYSVFAYFDHGNPFYLPESFYAMHYDVLQTESSLPLALVLGSDVGRFDLPAFNKAGLQAYSCLRPTSHTNPWQVSSSDLDSCDVLPERLVLQEHGTIGAIAMSRTMSALDASIVFTSMMRAVFEENALSLGEVLLSTRLLMYPSGSPDRNLMLFGDPAVNILWEDSVATSDRVDLSISASDIKPLDAVRGKYVSSSAVTLAIGVRNKGTTDATNVEYSVWEGPPETGTLLESSAIAEVSGFNDVAWDTITVAVQQDGVTRVFVQIDSTAYPEPTYLNNVASRKIYAYNYKPGFPIALTDRTTHSVTLANIKTDNFGDEILIQGSRAMRCFNGAGQALWQVTSQRAQGYADNANGTPLVVNLYKDAIPYVVYVDADTVIADVYVIDGQGAKVDSVAIDSLLFTAGPHATSFALADLSGDDGALELITVSGKFGSFGPKRLNAYSIENHSLVWSRSVGHSTLGFLQPANIAMGDIDLNGSAELLVRLSANVEGARDSLFCVRSNGARAWAVEGGGRVTPAPYDIAMIASTGEQLGEMNAITTARDAATGDVKVVSVDSSGASQDIVVENASDAGPFFSTGDMDGDSDLELVMSRDSTLAIYELSGSSTADVTSDVGPYRISPLLVDVNADGQIEVIAVSSGKNPYSPHESQCVLDVMTTNLTLLTRFEFPFRAVDVPASEGYGFQAFGGPAVGDIDDDGIAELAFVSLDSVLHVIELGQIGASPWPQRYGNPMQTNVAVQFLKGTYNTPVSLFNTVQVVDDVAFNEPVYVDGTAAVRVADEDPTPPGSPTADDKTVYTDIIVRDEFRSIGSEHQRVRFLSWDGSAESSNPWWSLFVSDSTLTASGEFIHTEIRGALSGITARRSITLQDCLIEDCSERGLNVADADTVIVEGTTIRSADYGINALDGTTVLLSNSIIADCAEYGVAVYENSILQATETSFDGNGKALYLAKETGSWVDGTITDCNFTNNNYGIWVQEPGDSTISVEDCTIESSGSTGLWTRGVDIIVGGTTIRGGEFGVTADQGTTLSLSNSAIEDASVCGVLLFDESELNATETSFDGNEFGLFLGKGSGAWVKGTIRDVSFTNNTDGIRIDDVGDSVVVVDDCMIDDNTTNGIYVEDDGDVSITRNTITNNAVGVFSYSSNPMIRSRNVIQYNADGIICDNYSVAVVESTTVNYNTNAVMVGNGSNPDLGHETGGSSLGQNIMRPNTYFVVNFTTNEISAVINYWPRNPPSLCDPQPSKFFGPVDYEPHLGCDAPDLSAPSAMLASAEEELATQRIPSRFSLRQNYPNPFNPVTTVAYEVPKPGSRVEIALYDVGGRLVAVLVDEHRTPGFYSVTWDGVNRSGEPVASGVYFLRMRAGHFVDTKKLLLLK